MGIKNKTFYLGVSLVFLWLAIYLPNLEKIFLIDLSGITNNQDLILLQYSALAGYLGSMIGVALD